MRQFPNVLFPYNGHYFDFDKFAEQIAKLVASAKIYDIGTAYPINERTRKQIVNALADRLRTVDEQ